MSDEEAFIRRMAADSSGEGVRHVVWILDSLETKLTDKGELQSFFAELARAAVADPTATWQTIWDRLCFPQPAAAHSLCRPAFARQRRVDSPAPVGEGLVHSLNASTWLTCHYNRKIEDYLDEGGTSLAATELSLGEAFNFAKKSAATWMQTPTKQAGAWLGRPADENRNCWVTAFQVDAAAPSWSPPTAGNTMLDQLGMPLPVQFQGWIVRYHINARLLPPSPEQWGVRPRFPDGGSRWFRVKCSDPKAAQHMHASLGWGIALSLAAIADGDADDAGLPERVCAAVPANSTAIVDMNLLSPVGKLRQMGPQEMQAAHDRLLDARKPSDTINQVLDILHK